MTDTKNAVEYINNVSWRESRLGLERMAELLFRLGSPEKKLPFIHIAGTNGKGSTSAMIASVLTAAGYKTGLFTSPYIRCFNERIQVDGNYITDEQLTAVTEAIRPTADAMEDHPTEFELVTAVALLHFLREGCDIVVLEVGLGGRLDATNIIPPPVLAIITALGLDHTAQLGSTLSAIAAEKGGIIKPGADVVLYRQPPEAERVIEDICRTQNARLTKVDLSPLRPLENSLAGQLFDYGPHTGICLPLLGTYQLKNAATVLTALSILPRKGWKISEGAIHAGLTGVRWPARFELVHRNPAVIVDGGHNPQCVEALVSGLETYFPGQKPIFLTGVMADKDYDAMFRQILPIARRVFTVTPDNPRALPAEDLAAWFQGRSIPAMACTTVEVGVEAALAAASREDVICAFGSFFMAGRIRSHFGLS